MKRFGIYSRILVVLVVLGSFQYFVFSLAELCWGAEKNNIATIQQIKQNIQAKASSNMSKENINLIAQAVLDESMRYGVDYRLVLAMISVESNFRHHVKSPDGARGLMQIAPSLAKGISKEAGIQYSGTKDLYDPRKNIRLGIYYISKLLELFDDIPTALFAYNVGHHKAQRLLAADKSPHTPYTKRVIDEYEKNTKKMINL